MLDPIDPENISRKSEMITAMLCLFLGQFGIHRFYTGKWKSALFYLLFGGCNITFSLLRKLGVGTFNSVFYTVITSVAIGVLILFDLFALYSNSFTDSHGRVIVSARAREEMGFISPEERFNEKANSVIILCVFFLAYASYFLITNFVL